MEEDDNIDIPSKDTSWLKKAIISKVEDTRSISKLDIDLQIRSKATRQKQGLVELIEKTPSTTTVKWEE